MEKTQSHDDVSTKRTRPTGRILLGVLFLLPSLFCWISQLLLPTINTFLISFQKLNLIGPEQAYVGAENYANVFGSENFGRAVGFTLTTLLVRLFVVAPVPLLLAWAVSQFGRPLRLGLRILLTLPVVFYLPAAIAVAWLMFLNPATGSSPFARPWAGNPADARSMLLFIDSLYLFGLASGLGLMFFLPLWRRSAGAPRPDLEEVWKPMLATWAVGILGIIVLTLNTFTLSFVMTNGGPAGSTSTLAILFYQFAFRNLNAGPAASVASLILLVTLVLGTAAGLLVILTRLRLNIVDAQPASEKADPPTDPTGSRVLSGAVLALLLLLILGVFLCSALPFGWLLPRALGEKGLGPLLENISAGQVFGNTFVPSLVSATLQVLIAYLAALGIGALRPFGKNSNWILLPFSPWLFISVPPLSLVYFMAAQKAGTLDTLRASFSPILFSVPALFILTIFFTGRASGLQRETAAGGSSKAPDFFRHFILPSLPLAAVLWLLLFFFNAQDIFWPLLVSISPERYTLNLTLFRLVQMFNSGNDMLAAAIVLLVMPICAFFFVCLVPFQIFYLDRLTLYAEDTSDEAAQDPEQN